MYDLLAISDKPGEGGALNSGNQVTNDLKVMVKMARLVGIHVSPTVVFDGVVANDISSSCKQPPVSSARPPSPAVYSPIALLVAF